MQPNEVLHHICVLCRPSRVKLTDYQMSVTSLIRFVVIHPLVLQSSLFFGLRGNNRGIFRINFMLVFTSVLLSVLCKDQKKL